MPTGEAARKTSIEVAVAIAIVIGFELDKSGSPWERADSDCD